MSSGDWVELDATSMALVSSWTSPAWTRVDHGHDRYAVPTTAPRAYEGAHRQKNHAEAHGVAAFAAPGTRLEPIHVPMTSDVVLPYLPFLPSRFEQTIDDTTYRLDASATQLAVGCSAVAVMILLVLALFARRRQGALVSPLVPLAVAATFASVVGAVFSLRRYGSARSAAGVFRSALQMDVVAAAVAVGVVVGATLVILLRERGQLALVPLYVPTVLVAGAGALVAEKHIRAILDVGELPVFAIEGSSEMHVGHDREVSVDLFGPARSWQFVFWRDRCDPCKLDTATRAKWAAPTKVHVHATGPGRSPEAPAGS